MFETYTMYSFIF